MRLISLISALERDDRISIRQASSVPAPCQEGRNVDQTGGFPAARKQTDERFRQLDERGWSDNRANMAVIRAEPGRCSAGYLNRTVELIGVKLSWRFQHGHNQLPEVSRQLRVQVLNQILPIKTQWESLKRPLNLRGVNICPRF